MILAASCTYWAGFTTGCLGAALAILLLSRVSERMSPIPVLLVLAGIGLLFVADTLSKMPT